MAASDNTARLARPMESEREFAFTEENFRRVRELIYKHAGIALNETKRNMVYSRLARRLRATGTASFDAYLATVESGSGPEWQPFVNALTTNLTFFFREQHHFPLLAEHLLNCRGKGEIRIWCAAASTGEQPYSMAITACEALGTAAQSVRILATDIDTSVLDRARKGEYPEESLDKVAPELRRRYFLRGAGENQGLVRARPQLQQMISFRQLNLLAPTWPGMQAFDAIFCRNVMIYFDKPTQHRILERFVPLLASGGRLFMGHSETLNQARDLFRLEGRTVYTAVRDDATLGRVA